MSSVFWCHGATGFEVRICTRETEVHLSSDMPVSSMAISFERGPAGAAAPAVRQQPALTDTENASASMAGIFYRFVPVVLKIMVYFEDEGTMRAWYNIDAQGRISTVNNGNEPNYGKGLGKGTHHAYDAVPQPDGDALAGEGCGGTAPGFPREVLPRPKPAE